MSPAVTHSEDDVGSNNPDKAKRVWEEANSWILKVHSGTMSEKERHDLDEWRCRDETHESQFRRAEEFWSALDGLADQVQREVPADRLACTGTSTKLPSRSLVYRSGRFRPSFAAIAATAVLILLASVMWSSLDVWLSDYHTHAGEQASVSLADGSTVHLNTRSALSVQLSDSRRALSLKQGEALFEVAHDQSRPFDVAVNGRVVRAIGTAFNVEYRGKRTTVSVVEGIVRLLHDGEPRDIPAGYRLTYESDVPPGKLEPIDPQVTAWRRKEFVFHDLPLAQIVEELNRYRIGPIVVLDSQLGLKRLSGSVTLEDPERSLRILQQAVPFRLIQVTSYLTLIS